MKKIKKKKIFVFSSSFRLWKIAAMDRFVKRFLVEAWGMVFCGVAVAASAMVAQVLREFCLSVFFASVNFRYDCSFD